MAEAIETTVADVTRPAPTMRLVALPEGMASDDWAAMRLGAALFARSGVEVAVLTWQGRGFIRLSAHLYNTSTDYERAARRYGRLFADPAWLAAAALG